MSDSTPAYRSELDLATPSDWFRWLRPSKVLILTLSIALMTCGLATWMVERGKIDLSGEGSNLIHWLIGVNLLVLLALSALILRRVNIIRYAVREGAVGSRLQRRMVRIFGLVTIIPTMIIAIFSAVFFHFGIRSWFDSRVQTAIEESVAVAEAYLEEHKRNITADVVAMSNDIRRDFMFLGLNPSNLTKTLNTQVVLRDLTDAMIFSRNQVVARSELSLSFVFERMPDDILLQATQDNVVILGDDDDRIRALIMLDEVTETYLLVGRYIDEKVLNHMVVAQGAVNQYRKLKKEIAAIQVQFSVLFLLVVALLLLSAVWYGIYTAVRLVVPISRLIAAADKVRAGDLSARVTVGQKKDEISELGRTFNRMAQQLEKQREELISANRMLDTRRRLTEAVLGGVSAGVVALDMKRVVRLNNRRAAFLLQGDENQSLKGMPMAALIPHIAPLLEQAAQAADGGVEEQISLERKGKKLNLHVRVTTEMKDGQSVGLIVTFDDITELLSAQRLAAWSDVARRIAHEIKNPLTPITLSAERLRRKYAGLITDAEDQEAYLRYLDTISKHAGDIGRMVEEFVAFARMPSAQRQQGDIRKTVREAVFALKTAHPSIEVVQHVPEQPVMLAYDERQMAQILMNLLKNAAEALEEKVEKSHHFKPQIAVMVQVFERQTEIVIEDNGDGFPKELLDKLTEPYVTTKPKGTGLGLAIVKRQMEEHRGRLTLGAATGEPRRGGARVCLSFPHEGQGTAS